MELRHRGNRSNVHRQMETFQISESSNDTKDGRNEAMINQKYLSAIPTLLVSLSVLIVLNSFVYCMDNKLPGTGDKRNSSYNDFVAERAMSSLVKLTNFGPRPVGSYENENLAFNLFKTEIENITSDTNNVHDVQMLNQKVSGSFLLGMQKWKYLLSYEDLQNVVVKLNPKRGLQNDAVLLNCHYDSVPAGPGVSDDGVNCAVMVELLRVLAKNSGLRRPIIFLFNGGEEIGLQASHGFITQHPWAQHVKYVINLDSCGAGGREILFQTTKTDSYLVDLYARSVPHPYGQAIGEELFQSGVIPSDTDFRIFRDFGNVSGLDLAHYKNGFVYHTEYDDLSRVVPPVLQNTGENLFELVKALSTHNATKSHEYKYVFFDAFGMYMFSYTELSGVVANFVIVMVSFFSIFLSFKFTTARMNRREYSVYILQTTVASPVCTVFLAVASCCLLAFCLDLAGASMSWYTNQINLMVYFATASSAVLFATAVHPKTESRTATEWTVSLLNGNQLFFTVLLFLTTMAGLRSAYLFAVIVLPPSVANCVLGMLNAYRKPALWLSVYAASLLVPITFVCYLTQMFVSLFVPLAGRIGPDLNPDYVVGALMAASTYATVGYLAPAVALVRNPRVLLATVAGWALLSVAVALVTPLGLPYSGGATVRSPAAERFDLVHTRRTFYGHDRTVRRNDSGVLVVNWDRHSRRTVAKHLPLQESAVPVDCARELLCGVPFPGNLAVRSSWIPLERPPKLPSLGRTAVTAVVGSGVRRLEFNVIGPERINVYISPYPGTRLKSWSFSDKPEATTRWEGYDVFVIRHSTGSPGTKAGWTFWLEQESDYGFDEKTINVTVTYSWVIHKQVVFELEDEFETLINSFPRWAHVNYAIASVDAFVY